MTCQDADSIDTVSYSMKTGNSAVFLIDSTTGIITLGQGKKMVVQLRCICYIQYNLCRMATLKKTTNWFSKPIIA